MRIKYVFIITLMIFGICTIFGIYASSKYWDVNDKEHPYEEFEVGIIGPHFVEKQIEFFSDEYLDNCEYILKCRCLDESTFLYNGIVQKVKVEKVYKGDNNLLENNVFIIKGPSVWTHANYKENVSAHVNMGYVNEMKVGSQYLIFADKKIPKTKIYVVGEESLISPIFNYHEENNQLPGIDENSLYWVVNYEKVKNNEFFFPNEEDYILMSDFKKTLFKKYN